MKNHAAKYVDSFMRTVSSKENEHTLSTFLLIVIHLEWLTFYLVRYVIRFMSEVLLDLSENVSITITVVLLGTVNNRGVWRVRNYMQIFLSRVQNGIDDMYVKIIEKADFNEPTKRERFWAYKLNSFVPHGINQRDFLLDLVMTCNNLFM